MIPYILLFVCMLFCSLMEVKSQGTQILKLGFTKKRAVKSIYVILPALMILLLGFFRDAYMGYDSETYKIYYWDRVDTYSWIKLLLSFSIDNGFFLLLKVIKLFTDDWWLCRAIIFVITFGLYYKGIEKDNPYPSMALMIFCGLSMLTFSFSILRQAIAGAICVHAYHQCQKGSMFKGVLLIFLAATFHKLSFISLLIPIIFMLRKKRFSGLKLVILSILSGLLCFVLIPIVVSIYAGGRYADAHQSEGGYGKLLFIIVVIIYTSRLLYRTTEKGTSDEILFNISCCALFAQVDALQWGLFTRSVGMFSVFWCMLIPRLINKLPSKERIIHLGIVTVLFGFMFFYQMNDVDMYIFHHF